MRRARAPAERVAPPVVPAPWAAGAPRVVARGGATQAGAPRRADGPASRPVAPVRGDAAVPPAGPRGVPVGAAVLAEVAAAEPHRAPVRSRCSRPRTRMAGGATEAITFTTTSGTR